MKLKFRAEKKDVKAFILVCILLLYIVCLAVLNIASFSQTGEFHGINPIPAFSPKYILTTLVYYIILVVALLATVSSKFYDREKGLGFEYGKKEDGYSRWAKDSEIIAKASKVALHTKKADAAGVPLLYDKKKGLVYLDNGEAHSLIIGATGSGKTQLIVHPMVKYLAKKGESMVITDPKGEIFEGNSKLLQEQGYKLIILNFRDPQMGNYWNPFTLPYKYYKEGNPDAANELLNDLAINIMSDEKSDDPFWQNSAADYFTGLSLGLFEDAKESQININSVNLMMMQGDERCGPSTYIKEYFKFKEPTSAAVINASGTINAPADTKDSIVSVLRQKVKVLALTQNLSEMLSKSDFDMDSIGEQKTAVFLVIQDEKTTYHALATIFIKQCYEALISTAQKHGGKLPVRTNFIMDEFANMPKIKDITTMITAARSRQIRLTMIIQNFAQLNQVYGKENAETIRGNCQDIIYLITGELSALEEISKLCGDKLVKVGKDKKEETRPLVTVSELQRMKYGDAILLSQRKAPYKTKLLDDWCNDLGFGVGKDMYGTGVYPSRERLPVDIFNLKDFVKQKKDEKLAQSSGTIGATPASKPAGASPFGGMPFGRENPLFENKTNTENKQTNPTGNKGGGLNIDELIKRIDKKIAEIEAEEKNESGTNTETGGGSSPTQKSVSDIVQNDSVPQNLQMAESTVSNLNPLPNEILSHKENDNNDLKINENPFISNNTFTHNGVENIKNNNVMQERIPAPQTSENINSVNDVQPSNIETVQKHDSNFTIEPKQDIVYNVGNNFNNQPITAEENLVVHDNISKQQIPQNHVNNLNNVTNTIPQENNDNLSQNSDILPSNMIDFSTFNRIDGNVVNEQKIAVTEPKIIIDEEEINKEDDDFFDDFYFDE